MKKLLVFIFISILSACHSVTYTTQVEEGTFIQFSGNLLGSSIDLNDVKFEIDEQTKIFDINDKSVAKFPIVAGKSLLTVSRNGEVIIKKYIFVTDGQTLEVNIP